MYLSGVTPCRHFLLSPVIWSSMQRNSLAPPVKPPWGKYVYLPASLIAWLIALHCNKWERVCELHIQAWHQPVVMCLCRQPDPVLRSVRWNPIFSRWHPSTLPRALLNNTRWRIDFVSGSLCVCRLWVKGKIPGCTRTSRDKSITGRSDSGPDSGPAKDLDSCWAAHTELTWTCTAWHLILCVLHMQQFTQQHIPSRPEPLLP